MAVWIYGHAKTPQSLFNTDLNIRLDRASIVQKLKPAKFCGGYIGRTQNTEIPTKPKQTETFVEICLYVYHIVVFEFNSVMEVHVDIYQ